MSKVIMNADDNEMKAISNFKLLGVGLAKAGVEGDIDPTLLCKGQPQAVLELLHKLYALAGPDTSSQPKGLSALDPNSFDSANSRRGKRRAAPPADPTPKRSSQPEEADGAASSSLAAEPAAAQQPTVEDILRRELDDSREKLAASREEHQLTAEERDFYMTKLECIEHACSATPADGLKREVMRLLRADPAELELAAAALS